jgi:hypothetical protein
MLMLIQILGPDYVVWDRSARIDFIKPGRDRLRTEFNIALEQVAEIKARTVSGENYLPSYEVDIRDPLEVEIARATKDLYIRRRPSG